MGTTLALRWPSSRGFSLRWFLLLWSTGSSHAAFSSCSMRVCSVAKSYLTLCDPYELYSAILLCPQGFPGEHTGVGCHFLLQGIFSTQGLNPGLLHCRQVVYGLSYRGSPCGRCRDIIQHFQLQPLWQVQGHHAALSAAAPVAGAGTSCSTFSCSPCGRCRDIMQHSHLQPQASPGVSRPPPT